MCLTIGKIVVSNTSREADDTSIALCNPRISPKILIFNVFQIYFSSYFSHLTILQLFTTLGAFGQH